MYLFRGLCHYATHEKTDSAAYIAYYVFCFCHLNELLLVALYAMHYYYRYLYTGERRASDMAGEHILIYYSESCSSSTPDAFAPLSDS